MCILSVYLNVYLEFSFNIYYRFVKCSILHFNILFYIYLATIFQGIVCKSAAAFSSDLYIIGALEKNSLFQVA